MIHHKSGRNPLLPLDVHLPDAEAHVMPDGRLYLYGSSDKTEGEYCSNEYRVASTDDMANWTVHGVSFHADQADWASNTVPQGKSFLDGASSYEDLPAYTKSMLPPEATSIPFEQFAAAVREQTRQRQPSSPRLYAPDAIEKDGKYYLYFCLSDDSEGVAVADRPEGPFGQATRLPVTGIDPAVFVDEDGQAYYYWGQFSANGARLNSDMTSIDSESTVAGLVTEHEHNFHEGSSMRKRGDTYYLVFADTSRGRPTSLGYATSTSPLGPFTYRGVIIDNAGCDPESWNNHGSIEEFNGQWYVFYHRSSRNVSSMRRVCVEPIFFAEDGSIPEVIMTSQGAGRPFQQGEVIPAFTACSLTGTAYIAPFEGTEAVVDIGDGDCVNFRYLENTAPLGAMSFHTRGRGLAYVYANGQIVGTADLETGKADVTIPAGTHEIELVFRTSVKCTLIDMTFD